MHVVARLIRKKTPKKERTHVTSETMIKKTSGVLSALRRSRPPPTARGDLTSEVTGPRGCRLALYTLPLTGRVEGGQQQNFVWMLLLLWKISVFLFVPRQKWLREAGRRGFGGGGGGMF